MTFFIGLTNSFVVAIALAGAMGLAGGFFINMNQALIQANTPQPLMGRVMGIYSLVSQGLLPLGALIVAVIASRVGTGVAISIVSALGLIVVTMTYIRNAELRGLD